MARAIDAEKFMELLKEQYLHHKSMGHNQMAKAWQGAMQLLHDMPTLTPPNEWVSAKDRLPEAGALIVYANNYGNEALYGVLRAPKNERPNRYDYWAYLPKPPDRRPPEGGEDT